jgi:hypothetical protein
MNARTVKVYCSVLVDGELDMTIVTTSFGEYTNLPVASRVVGSITVGLGKLAVDFRTHSVVVVGVIIVFGGQYGEHSTPHGAPGTSQIDTAVLPSITASTSVVAALPPA